MTQITSIPSGFAPTDQSRGGAGQSALPGETLPIEKLHRRLRGRYVFALLMGIVCAAAAGYLGYNRRQPVYPEHGSDPDRAGSGRASSTRPSRAT